MTVRNVKASLERISKSMSDVRDAREFLLKNTRDVVASCSRSIIAVHGGGLEEAAVELDSAGRKLRDYRKRSRGDLRRYLVTPEQEFVEAAALLAVAEGRQIPARGALGVSEEAYVLGLLDCIGELKRFVLDKIRNDRLDEALEAFDTMGCLFSLLYPFASLDKVIRDARRKLDVGRMLVEDVRIVVTQEIRRKDLVDAIRRLEGSS